VVLSGGLEVNGVRAKAVCVSLAVLASSLVAFWYFSFDEGVEGSEFKQEAGFTAIEVAKALAADWNAADVQGVEWEPPSSQELKSYGASLGALKKVIRYTTPRADYVRGRDVNRVYVVLDCEFERRMAALEFEMSRAGKQRWTVERVSVRSDGAR
jgi:hypothetical protein